MRLHRAMGDLGHAFFHPVHRSIVLCALVALASGCGGGGQTQPAAYTVGGSISGLTAGGLILANGSQTVSPAANATSFVFPTQSTSGTSYSVSVQTAPTGQTCTVSSASGTVTTANVTNVVVTCASAAAVLYSFGAVPDGAVPTAGVIQGSDGNFYGTTSKGGATSATCTVVGGCGTVFKLTPAGVETVLYSFTGVDGDGGNISGLIQGSDGNFYGTTSGTVFKLTAAGVETVLHSFTGTGGDGSNPYGGVIEGSDGNFYGTTSSGGANTAPSAQAGCGTVFKITAAGVETVLYSFNCAAGDGEEPLAALIQGSDGNFYGTTSLGGANGAGSVFKIAPAGVETVLYSFEGDACGASNNEVPSLIVASNPAVSLIEGSDGNFYGTTSGSETSCGNGTVFKVTPAGVETLLYAFDNATSAANPRASLIQGSDGNFYGTTYFGGAGAGGTVFMVTPAGVEVTIYSFTGTYNANPEASLIQTSNGNFYGTTSGGGTNGNGSVFELSH